MQVTRALTESVSQSHKDLLVFRRAYDVSLSIYKLSATFPKDEKYGITDQLKRASSSVCANIAEGYGRQLTSDTDFRRFLVMAKGSCQEVLVWIDIAKDLGFLSEEKAQVLYGEYVEISKMLFALIKKL